MVTFPRLSSWLPLPPRGGLVCLLVLAAAGCGEESAFRPAPTWSEVRYHWSDTVGDPASSLSGDVIVRSGGEIDLVLRGEGAAARGLLAGENLETLARLIDALPPAGYSGEADCEESFFLSVATPDERRAYSGSPCDPAMPEPLLALTAEMRRWVEEDWARRPETVAFRILAEGSGSPVAREGIRIVEGRDGLVRLIESLGPDGPVVLPAIDFRKEIVVAVFLGDTESAAASVTIAGAHRTEGGQVVLTERRVVSAPGCPAAEPRSGPFVIAVVEASKGDDLLIETETVLVACREGTVSR